MVVTQNIVRAATWLLFTLAGVAGIFFLLGADFVGATQLLVYVGGTLVLVVFGVMLTAQGPFINMRIGAGEWAIAAAAGISFFSVLAYALINFDLDVPAPAAPGMAVGRIFSILLCAASVAGLGWLVYTMLTKFTRLPVSGLPVAVRNRLGPPFGRADRGRLSGPQQASIAQSRGHAMMDTVGLTPYLLVGALLFVCGALCMATKRNAIGILMGVELVLNGATVNFVAFAHFNPAFEIEGQIFALFVIVLAAAEAAVALAIVLNFYNNHMTVDVDTAEELKG